MAAKTRQEFVRGLANALAVGVCAAVCCGLSIGLTRLSGPLPPLWLTGGVLTGLLVTGKRERWPSYLVGAFVGITAIRLVFGDPWFVASGMALAGVVEAAIVAFALMRLVGDVKESSRVALAAQVAFGSGVIASAVSATLAAGILADFGVAHFALAWIDWFLPHLLGMVIFATLVVIASAQGSRMLGKPGRRLELALTVLLLAVVCTAVFWQSRYPFLFLIFPLLLLCIFRHRFVGFVYGETVVVAIGIAGTLAGTGPFMLGGSDVATRILLLQAFLGVTCLVTMPVAVVLVRRGLLARSLRESEARYRLLAEYSRDFIVRIDRLGRRRYISPAVTETLGWAVDEFVETRWDLVHPDDLAGFRQALQHLFAHGGAATHVFRVRHKRGDYVWLEASMKLAPGADGDQEVIFSCRDVSRRVEAELALKRQEYRLRAITDNIPAFVVYLDLEQKYVYANAHTLQLMGLSMEQIIGRSAREVLGDAAYAEVRPHLHAALRGETTTFEIERDFNEQHRFLQSTYVPDIGAEGEIRGVYVLTFDISRMKHVERDLAQLARQDTLTGLPNRLHFNERLELALAKQRRDGTPIALLYIDIDHFKSINDSFGHAAGDAVLREFARRLRAKLRETDFAARVGGDEFVILPGDVESPAIAEVIAHKLSAKVSAPIAMDGSELRITLSIGIAYSRNIVANADELLQMADDALYQAKSAGRDTWRAVTSGVTAERPMADGDAAA